MAAAAQRKSSGTGTPLRLAALAVVVARALVPALAIDAQSPSGSSGCESRATPARVFANATGAAVVTGIEYRDMTRRSGWGMARELDRAAIAADPSSHLHAFGSYIMARNVGASACVSPSVSRRAAWKGAAISLAIGAAKEVSDGRYNGFSPTDLAVDAVGAGYAVAQAHVPVLRHVTPTFSVSPHAIRSPRGPLSALTDYAHQTFWLSTNVHDALPASVARAWPSAVRVSVGRRAYGGGSPSDYVLGLDLDAARLPGSHPAWVRLKQALHNVRLPGPALVMSANGTRALGLYW
jgi:hypothetical protein